MSSFRDGAQSTTSRGSLDRKTAAGDISPEMPSPGVRSAFSLAVFFHLLCVVVALSSYTSPSRVQGSLRVLLGPYLKALNLDFSHPAYNVTRYHLTHGSPSDVDFRVEVDAPDGQSVVAPDPGMFPGERYRRYKSLANAAGNIVVNVREGVQSSELQAELPRAIAGSVLTRLDASTGAVRVVGHYLQSYEAVGSSVKSESDPNDPTYVRTMYEAKILLGGGQIDVMPATPKGEVAPLRKGTATSGPVDADPTETPPASGPSDRGAKQ